MTVDFIRSVLLWSLIINAGLLLWWFILFMVAHDWMHRVHGKWFQLSVGQFDAIHYAGMGIFKIAIFVFYLVPYIALTIVG